MTIKQFVIAGLVLSIGSLIFPELAQAAEYYYEEGVMWTTGAGGVAYVAYRVFIARQ